MLSNLFELMIALTLIQLPLGYEDVDVFLRALKAEGMAN
jgi:hypothetical protein